MKGVTALRRRRKVSSKSHKDMTVTSKEQARQKQLDFLENMKLFEEVYEDELPAGTHVMSGRWVDTMKTPTMWKSIFYADGEWEESQQYFRLDQHADSSPVPTLLSELFEHNRGRRCVPIHPEPTSTFQEGQGERPSRAASQ